jgi:hypothetical protein
LEFFTKHQEHGAVFTVEETPCPLKDAEPLTPFGVSVSVRLPDCKDVFGGVNWTTTAHCAPAARVVPQVVEKIEKPVPVMDSETFSVAPPVFSSKMLLLVADPPMTTDPKA